MSRLYLRLIVVSSTVLVPSLATAQYAVVSPCGAACARISIIPAPPVGVPAWLQPMPTPVVPPPAPRVPLIPQYVRPAPVAPAPAVLDPWILHALRPAPATPNTSDLLPQLLVLQQLAAARRQPQSAAPAPAVVAPAPSAVPQDGGWMGGFIKGPK